MDSIGMPRWRRMVQVAGVVILVAGSAAFAYRWYYRPTTLTIAVGSLDGETARIVSAIADRLVSMKAPARLSVIDMPSSFNRMLWFDPDQTWKRGDYPVLDEFRKAA